MTWPKDTPGVPEWYLVGIGGRLGQKGSLWKVARRRVCPVSHSPMITLDKVRKHFGGAKDAAVERLSLTIANGEVVALVGPSGCGKTTTLRMINRLIEPSSGTITVAGSRIDSMPAHELRRSIGYVIQQIGLFPHRTVSQNIATVPTLLGWNDDRVRSRIEELAELVDIDPTILHRYPSELSGGQRQRIGVARALAADPPVLLMDEPFGAVDPIVRGRLQQELLALQTRLNKTIVFVTHDIDEAILIGDRVAILNTGGVLEQFATPGELLAQPATPFVADFLGSDRAIKRLSLLRIDASVLDVATPTPGHDPGSGTIRLGATLKEALGAIVAGNGREVGVCDGDVPVGVITIDTINRALTRRPR